MTNHLRIGLVDQTTDKWTASHSYTRMMAFSLRAACEGADAEVGYVTKGGGLKGVDIPVWQIASPRYFPGEVTLRSLTGTTRKSALDETSRINRIDVLLPMLDLRLPVTTAKTIGWIPDFQDRHLPEHCPEPERKHRAEIVERLAERATRVLLSSNASVSDFRDAAPQATSKVAVLPFPSLFAFEPPAKFENDARARYHLPEKFALVVNQFWSHKNHVLVIEAARQLRERGVEIPIVMTGLPLDHRDTSNRAISDVLQAVSAAGLRKQTAVLGHVPFPELVSLIRSAAVVIQPSRFEGWSTIVQDAKALGRPVLCSDIAVHREQAPDALGFFGVDDPAALADLLANHWPNLALGPNPSAESAALAREQLFAKEHGAKLLALCREVSNIR